MGLFNIISTFNLQSSGLTLGVRITLFYSVMMMVVGQAFLFTILPSIGREVGMADYQIGLVMSVHGLFMLFTAPMWAVKSDLWGRRSVIIIGTIAYIISVVMFGLIVDAALSGLVSGTIVLWLLVGSRALFAIGAGGVTPSAMALAADMSNRSQRLGAISLLAAASSMGAILGPSVSAFFTGFGLSFPFYIISILALLIIVSAYIFLPPSARPIDNSLMNTRSSYKGLLQGSVFIIALSSVFLMSGTYGIFSIMGFFIQDRFDLGTIQVAQMLGVGLMCAAAANVFVQTFLIQMIRVRIKILVSIGIWFSMCSIFLFWLGDSRLIFFVAMFFNGLGLGFSMPALNTALSLSAGATEQGRIAGISTSCQSIAFLVAPMSAAAFYQLMPILPFMIAVIIILLAQATLFLAVLNNEEGD